MAVYFDAEKSLYAHVAMDALHDAFESNTETKAYVRAVTGIVCNLRRRGFSESEIMYLLSESIK